jgi:hypothetical protein
VFNTTVSSASGLELRVFLNTTLIGSGGTIASGITLLNSLDENLTLIPTNPANPMLANWNDYDSFSGGTPLISMVGYALFQGYYSAGNISVADNPLRLAPYVNVDDISYPIPSTVVFLPESEIAVLYLPGSAGGITESITAEASNLSCVNTFSETYECRGDSGLSGYWNTTALLMTQQASLGSRYFHHFSPGEYTLAVQDMWNQSVYAHFQVTPQAGTTSSTSSSSSPSVPPPTTTVTDYGCTILGRSQSESSASGTTSSVASNSYTDSSVVVLVNTSGGSFELNVNFGSSDRVETATCSYVFTNTTTPVACGVMCGGGIGKTEQYSYVWKLNFSLSSADSAAGQNLTISQGRGMNSVFPEQGNHVSLDSQMVTWYSNPACYGGDGVESDCMTSNATSITIELPSSIENGTFQLVISSSADLVP